MSRAARCGITLIVSAVAGASMACAADPATGGGPDHDVSYVGYVSQAGQSMALIEYRSRSFVVSVGSSLADNLWVGSIGQHAMQLCSDTGGRPACRAVRLRAFRGQADEAAGADPVRKTLVWDGPDKVVPGVEFVVALGLPEVSAGQVRLLLRYDETKLVLLDPLPPTSVPPGLVALDLEVDGDASFLAELRFRAKEQPGAKTELQVEQVVATGRAGDVLDDVSAQRFSLEIVGR